MDIDSAREQMITQQLRAWHVLSGRILESFSEIPRERFTPPAYAGLAFADTSIPIGHDQIMWQPKVQGRLLQALQPAAHEAILDIGTGTGFLAACMARLGAQVHTIDIHADFVEAASRRLSDLGIDNVSLEGPNTSPGSRRC
jgi:protein-L-isoaspartate(D-aspartate) O-methyltransferase